MANIQVHSASGKETTEALRALDTELRNVSSPAHLLFTFYGATHDDSALHSYLTTRFPGTPIIGGTSSGGFMTHRGMCDENSIGVLLIEDPDGDYGVASGPLGDNPSQAAETLLQQALANCGCSGELPELIWAYQTPGHEEAVIEGLRRVVGDRCPIIGGSSADNDVSGNWRQLGTNGPSRDGLVIAVLFPSSPVDCAFQGGYEPAGPSGIVTGVAFHPAGDSGIVTSASGRQILTIDGESAAEVYNRWTDGRVSHKLPHGGTILAETTMCPIAVDGGRSDGVTQFLLVHPESVHAGGAMSTFCAVNVGDRVYAMKGDRSRLIDRADRVVQQAKRALSMSTPSVAGALMVYCAGCKMAVGEDIAQVAAAVARGLGDAPFIGCFTFGEQGRLIDKNVHGNLMISAVAFGA
jgi:hypothetical protein